MIWQLPLRGFRGRAQVREKTRGRSDTKRRGFLAILGVLICGAAAGSYELATTWTLPIVVATRALPSNSLLTADDLGIEYVSALDHVFPGALTDVNLAVGKYTVGPLVGSQPLVASQLAANAVDGDRVVNGVKVAQGLQLVAANVALDDAAGGIIDRGSHVNLMRLPIVTAGAPVQNRQVTLFATNVLVVSRPNDTTQAARGVSFTNLNAPTQPIDGSNARLVFAAPPELALLIAGYGHSHELGVIVPVGESSVQLPMVQPLDTPTQLTPGGTK